MTQEFVEDYHGWCPICERQARFRSRNTWFRGHLLCTSCEGGSVPRERALAVVLNEIRPNWRDLRIHESSPGTRGISAKLAREAKDYTASQYFPNETLGGQVGQWVNEDLENQTFPDNYFDLVISLDVMEHLFDPLKAWREIFRTLKPGGLYIHTFPIIKSQVDGLIVRSEREPDGSLLHLKEQQFHGNPIDKSGSLVTVDYGYDVHKLIAEVGPYAVRVLRFADRYRGILGEFTEVVICEKTIGAIDDRATQIEATSRVPPDDIQRKIIGKAGTAAISEAQTFVAKVKAHSAEFYKAVDERFRVLDFGCGYGRIAAQITPSVPEANIVGVDVDAELLGYARGALPAATFIQCDVLPPVKHELGSFDLILAYAVFSSLAEEAARRWIDYFADIIKPGGLVAITTRPRGFIGASSFAGSDQKLAKDLLVAYDRGEFAFFPSFNEELRLRHYGEAAIPEAYARAAWNDKFELKQFDTSSWQPIIVLTRRSGSPKRSAGRKSNKLRKASAR